MLYSILVRTLKEGVEFGEFRDAWLPDPVDDGVEFRVVHARSVSDPRQIASIAFMDVEPDQIEAFMKQTEEENARRHDRIEPLLEGERQLVGLFEQVSDDRIAL